MYAAYPTALAGGTEVMRLGSSVDEDAVLIDINSLPLSGIRKENGKVIIGALTTLQEIKETYGFDANAILSSMNSMSESQVDGSPYFTWNLELGELKLPIGLKGDSDYNLVGIDLPAVGHERDRAADDRGGE